MVRWVSKHCDPVMATGWHMVLGSLPLAALSLALEGDELLPRLAQIDGAPPQGVSNRVRGCVAILLCQIACASTPLPMT